jgi:thiamine biosynthesis lipoprotein
MSTVVEITAVGKEKECRIAVKKAFDEMKRIDSLMNTYHDDSEISHINKAAGISAVGVSVDTLTVIKQALEIADLTNGAFDITVAPLMDLWGFRNGVKLIPDSRDINERLSLVDYTKVIVNESQSTVKLARVGMQMDVSGIAKGYAVDKAINILKNLGIRDAIVNAGGDIYALGSPPEKDSWWIGIRHPKERTELLGVLRLKDEAVATSGDYENYFEEGENRYCHIIDTNTGYPVQGVASVTIVADNTAKADALATAVFPMGLNAGMQLIESLEGIEGVIVSEKGKDLGVINSSGLEGKFRLKTF